MKNFLYLFLFLQLTVVAQNDTISSIKSNIAVISADKLNVVYRGVLNPISISVPNCKSFTATAPGLTKISNGKYNLAPGLGLFSIIKLDIELNDGSKIIEEHKFRIKGINSPVGTINGRSCSDRCILEMTKEELFDAIIGFSLSKDFLFDLDISDYKIKGFTLKISNSDDIEVKGNEFNTKVENRIKTLKTGSVFTIDYIHYSFPGSENYCLPRLVPIKVMIVDKEVSE